MTPADLARLRALWETHPPIEDCCNIGAPWLVALVNAAPELLAAAERDGRRCDGCTAFQECDYRMVPRWKLCRVHDRPMRSDMSCGEWEPRT